MNFDFTKALQEAQKVTDQSNNSGTKYSYKLVYPLEGALSFRILFNPKSNSIIRKIVRHNVGSVKVPCLTTYGLGRNECPICNVANNINNTTGSVPKGLWATTRGLCFIQYISSTYKIDGLNKGDVALLMVPKTMYEAIQGWIVQITSGDQGVNTMYEVFCNRSSMEMIINRTSDNNYTFTMNPYNKFESAKTDEEFNSLLESIPDLNEQLVPAQITEELSKSLKEAEDNLTKTYLESRIPTPPSQTPVATPQGFSNPHNNFNPNTFPQEAYQSTTGQPPLTPQGATVASTPETFVKPKPCYGTYNKLQNGTDAVSMALKGLCATCQYKEECSKLG